MTIDVTQGIKHHEGDRPISITWQLKQLMPIEIFRRFSVRGEDNDHWLSVTIGRHFGMKKDVIMRKLTSEIARSRYTGGAQSNSAACVKPYQRHSA